MRATRSSRKAARSLSLPVIGNFLRLFRADAKSLRRDLDILVATAREVDDDVLPWPDLPGHLLGVEDGVGRLESRDDAFKPRAEGEGFERLLVGNARVLGESTVFEVGVLRAGSRIVEAGGDRVSLPDLAPLRLQDVAESAVQDAKAPLRERCPVLARRESPARCLHTNEPHALSSDERVEGADGVGSRAEESHDRVRVTAETLSTL